MKLERKTVNLAVKWAYGPKHANLNFQYTAGVGHQVSTEGPRLCFVTLLYPEGGNYPRRSEK